MESFILAAALRVIWAAVDDGDAKLEQPHREPCPSLAGRITPGRTIVDEEGLREPVMAKGLLQAAAHGICALIGTGLQAQIIAGVVIHHRQRMALGIVAEPNPAFEVHLPQQIGGRHLETLACHRAADRRLDAARPTQDLMNC